MRRSLARTFGVLTVAAALVAGCGSSGSAKKASTSTSESKRSAVASSSNPIWSVPHQSPGDVASYWTPKRMAEAKPYPRGASGAGAREPRAAEPSATPVSIDPVRADHANRSASAASSLVPADPTLAPQRPGHPYKLYKWNGPITSSSYPAATEGKIFFSEGSDDYVCSGTAINSGNQSVVWTAGHCVVDGGSAKLVNGAWTWQAHSNWVFVPGYVGGGACGENDNGASCPFGQWVPRPSGSLWALDEWTHNGNHRFDFGAVVVQQRSGNTLVGTVGGEGIKFFSRAKQTYLLFGYPESAPFDGSQLYECKAKLATRYSPQGSGPPNLEVGCAMTGGSSGGGWLVGLNGSGLGYVVSVNSSGPDDQPIMDGPYQGKGAKALFDAVRDL